MVKMNWAISELYKCKTGGQLSANVCQEINSALANMEVSEIPGDQYENVKEYILVALNMNSVASKIVPKLERLLSQLET